MSNPPIDTALLKDHVAIVTGAGRGIGRAHALALAARGATVVVADVAGADDTANEIVAKGGRARGDGGDLGSIAAGEALVARAIKEYGRIDIVINNAGISRSTPIAELTVEEFDAHLGVHLHATIGTTKAAFAAMKDSGGGAILNTTSGAGLDPMAPNTTGYATAKAAVYAFTKVAALEGAPIGVRVNAISPLALTKMSEGYLSTRPANEQQFLIPDRIAEVAAFLVSPLAAGITGKIVRVDDEGIKFVRMDNGVAKLTDPFSTESLAAHVSVFTS